MNGLESVAGRKRSVIITERDLKIIEFILEMKFASCSEIYRKFFSRTLLDEPARSSEWARKRLFQLERGGFLRSAYAFSESTRYFTATMKGYRVLKEIDFEKEFCKPIGIDLRTFAHDKIVLLKRLELEEREGIVDWISDRKLKCGEGKKFGLSAQYIPDAVFKLQNGDRVALEVEIATKSKNRYQEKVRRYVSVIRSGQTSPQMFRKVQFLCLNKSTFEAVESQTRVFGSLFETTLEVGWQK